MTYDLDNFEPAAKIVVIGVGGAGNNAVNRMIDEEIANVEFFVANTDKQALASSKARNRIILGESLTGGLGAGGEPEMGEKAAEASVDQIKEIVKDANMVFIAAGMGGGTGTGAAPVIARIAKDAGALVIAIVTRPFSFEGKKRIANSIDGLNKLRSTVDSIIVVSNDKLLLMSGNSPIGEAFNESDKVLAQSVKTVVNLILIPAIINLDFADVRNTLKDAGVALIGYGIGSGPNRAKDADNSAINSPLLEASMSGARRAIVSITCGPQVNLFEAQETVNLLNSSSGNNIDIKFGIDINPNLSDDIFVSVIASNFEHEVDFEATSSPLIKQHHDEPIFTNNDHIESQPAVNPATNENETSVTNDDILPNLLKGRD